MNPVITSLEGKRVDVYRNLHKNSLSIRYQNKVVAWVPSISLKDSKYKVSQSGRQRVLEQRRKNVHAVISGVVTTQNIKTSFTGNPLRECTYNPYKYSSFVHKINEEPVFKSDYCQVVGNRIFSR